MKNNFIVSYDLDSVQSHELLSEYRNSNLDMFKTSLYKF